MFARFDKYIEEIEKNGVSPKTLADIIRDHKEKRKEMIESYGRYLQDPDYTPIFSRKFENKAGEGINNKVANDWFGEIVDTKTGYLFGAPVVYQLERDAKTYEETMKYIERFKKINSMDDLNGEWGKFSAICGYDGGLCYIDNDGETRVTRINPWEVIILSHGEISEPKYGIRYYEKYVNDFETNHVVVFYNDREKITFEGESFGAYSLHEVDRKPHTFDYCPLFGIPNNAELMGDVDKVESLIDAYDRSMSDMNNEVEQFRLAYMIWVGYSPEDEDIANAKETGALSIPDAEHGAGLHFLTKDLNPSYVDSHLDRLEKNIERFGKHVNFSEAFGGGQVTGPAMRYKLFALETKTKISERKHEAATLYMFKVLASAWAKRNIILDYTQIDCKYTRNIPVNIVDEANAALALLGITSKRTALEQLPMVNDVEAELERIEAEKEEREEIDIEEVDDEQGENGGAE